MPPPAQQLRFGGRVHARVQLEIVGRHLLRPYRTAEMTGMAWECLRRNASFERDYQTDLIVRSNFERPNPAALGLVFSQLIPIDPSSNRQSFGLRAVPTIVPVRPASPVEPATHVRLDLSELNESQFRQGADGWHAVLSLRGVEHRIWFKEAPIIAAAYTVELPLDRDFEFRRVPVFACGKGSMAGPRARLRTRFRHIAGGE